MVFFVQRWYWCGQTANVVKVGGNLEDSPDYGDRAELFEPTVSDRNIGIKIRNLTKVIMQLFAQCPGLLLGLIGRLFLLFDHCK